MKTKYSNKIIKMRNKHFKDFKLDKNFIICLYIHIDDIYFVNIDLSLC